MWNWDYDWLGIFGEFEVDWCVDIDIGEFGIVLDDVFVGFYDGEVFVLVWVCCWCVFVDNVVVGIVGND